jgi:hypothetical protein
MDLNKSPWVLTLGLKNRTREELEPVLDAIRERMRELDREIEKVYGPLYFFKHEECTVHQTLPSSKTGHYYVLNDGEAEVTFTVDEFKAIVRAYAPFFGFISVDETPTVDVKD